MVLCTAGSDYYKKNKELVFFGHVTFKASESWFIYATQTFLLKSIKGYGTCKQPFLQKTQRNIKTLNTSA